MAVPNSGATAKIQRYTAGLTFERFSTDDLTIDAVIRNFQILGEAARHVPADVQARWPQVPGSQIRGMRHIVIHEYSAVTLAVVWEAIVHDLPELVPLLREIPEREP